MTDEVKPWINKGVSDYHGHLDFENIEERMNAKYVGDFCLKFGQTWTDNMFPVFYQANPSPEHNPYFALKIRDGGLYIMDGMSTVGVPIAGSMGKSGEVVYSRCRWDSRWTEDGTANIDGGRDYTKTSGGKRVWLVVDEGDVRIVDDVSEYDQLAVKAKLQSVK